MIKFTDDDILLEIIINDKFCTLMMLNYIESIKNKKIYDEKLY